MIPGPSLQSNMRVSLHPKVVPAAHPHQVVWRIQKLRTAHSSIAAVVDL
jgi:hypothetical protein